MFEQAGLKWLDWHREWVRGVYGPVDIDTGKRLITESFTSIAKKNGKSMFLGAVPLVHLAFDNTEALPLAVGVATSVEQAREVYDSACYFYERVPEFKRLFQPVRSTRRILRRERPSWMYKILTSDGRSNDGIRPSLGIIDELHQFRMQGDLDNLSAVRRGVRGKNQPLVVTITTAGDPNLSEEWVKEYGFAKRALQEHSRYRHVYIREADPERMEKEPDYWRSREARLAANPSHEDFGGFIRDEDLRKDLERAEAIPTEYRSFLRFTLNRATQADEQFIPYQQWVQCGQVQQRPLLNRTCIVGLDLSVTTDLTALAAVFPDEDGGYDLKVWFWMPSKAIAERERRDRQPYSQWVQDGLIEATEGDAVNLDAVRHRLNWMRDNFDVQAVVYDPAHAQKLVTELAYEDGFACEKQVQSGAKFSAALRHLNDVILARKLRHGGDNPVLDWMAQCVVAAANHKEELHIVKPDRRKHSTRVDGISATVTALCHAMTLSNSEVSLSVL